MKRKSLAAKAFCLLLAIMLAPACAPTPQQEAQTVFRYRGQELRLPAKPQKVVLLSSALTELWLGAGGKSSLAGCPLSGELDEELKQALPQTVADIGLAASLNMEKILELRPELVVGLADKALHRKIGAALRANGISYLEVRNLCFQDNCDILQLFGELLEDREKAARLAASLQQQLEAAGRRSRGQKPVRVLMLWGSVTNVLMITPNSRQGELLQLAGGENIVPPSAKEHGYLPLSLEFVAERQPDIILLQAHGEQARIRQRLQRELLDNPAWSSLQAVKQGRVYFLPPELFTVNPGLKTPAAAAYLSEILYPQAN